MLGVLGARDTRGRATGGLLLSVVIAAAVTAFVVYYMTGSGGSHTSDGGIDPSEFVDETREKVARTNEQREQMGEALRQGAAVSRTTEDRVAQGAWENQVSRALRDCGDIKTAIEAFHRDVSKWPVEGADDEDVRVDYLYGDAGRLPKFAANAKASWGERAESLHSYLVSNGPKKRAWYDYFKHSFGRFDGWNGPYLPREEQDPWGHAYVVSVSGFAGGARPSNHVWCLSAGPNGVVETSAESNQTLGDDVGKVME